MFIVPAPVIWAVASSAKLALVLNSLPVPIANEPPLSDPSKPTISFPVERPTDPSLSNGTFIATSPVPDARVIVPVDVLCTSPGAQQTVCRNVGAVPVTLSVPAFSNVATVAPPNPISPADHVVEPLSESFAPPATVTPKPIEERPVPTVRDLALSSVRPVLTGIEMLLATPSAPDVSVAECAR